MYKGYRFSAREIISAECLHRFFLSLWEIELLMTARGVEESYETIHPWCTRFEPEKLPPPPAESESSPPSGT